MNRMRGILHMSFLALPILAGVVGYRYVGWVGVFVYPIAAVALLGFVLVVLVIACALIEYLRDQARVSHLSVDQLHLIVASPADADFRFAFAELVRRGADVGTVQQSLLAMVDLADSRKRGFALERLKDIYPRLRHVWDEVKSGDAIHRVSH